MNKVFSLQKLYILFSNTFNEDVVKSTALPGTGSDRKYVRLEGVKNTVLGVFNEDVTENNTYLYLSNILLQQNINVPKVFGHTPEKDYYLVEDLGPSTLASFFKQADNEISPEGKLSILKQVLQRLAYLQQKVDKVVDYNNCYPRAKFDTQSMQWDLNYFKYCFLKTADLNFDEQLLENDFTALIKQIGSIAPQGFMYRDFQLRNIMWKNDEPWFIDFQGGRKGPLFYDAASIIYSPTTALNVTEREALIRFYLSCLYPNKSINATIRTNFYTVALIRVLQALGAYGYRGLVQQKTGFSASIKTGIKNLSEILSKIDNSAFPELENIKVKLEQSVLALDYPMPKDKLTINIISFSYKRGIPADPSENGGGFVIDCRGIPNPGRYKEYKKLSGLDEEVIEYLEDYRVVHDFAKNIKSMIKISTDNYIERGFNHICIYFGCTGGQHRSVYNAERAYSWLTQQYGEKVNLNITHRERNYWKL